MSLAEAALNKINKIEKQVATATNIVQRKLMEPFFGFNNVGTGVDNRIFTNANWNVQGLAYLNVNGQEKVYVMNQVDGDGSWETQRCRIVEFNLAEDGSEVNHVCYSDVLNIGHQSLSAILENGEIYLYTTQPAIAPYTGLNVGKGVGKIHWKGAETTQSDVTSYPLFGLQGSGHVFQEYLYGTPVISTDGKYIVVSTSTGRADETAKDMLVYDREELENSADPTTVMPISLFKSANSNSLNNASDETALYCQGLACDGKYIYMLRGYLDVFGTHIIQIYDIMGNLIRALSVDDVRAYYGRDNLLNHPTLGTPCSFEPEGLALRGNDLLIILHDKWRYSADNVIGSATTSDIVTWEGYNWVCITANTGKSPTEGYYWARTNKPATKGTWNSTTAYVVGSYTRVSKVIYSVGAYKGLDGEEPTNSGIVDRSCGAEIYTGDNATNVAYSLGSNFSIRAFSQRLGKYRNSIIKAAGNVLRIYDEREGSNNTKFSSINTNFSGTRELMELRAYETLAKGAGFNAYGKSDSASAGIFRIYSTASDGSNKSVELDTTGAFKAGTDNTQSLGTSSARFSTVYAGTGAINTSDRDYKQDVSTIPETVLDAWAEVKFQQFRYKDAVEQKGDNARYHIGVIAQDIKEAFERHGLDATKYGLLCYDEWEHTPAETDEEGNIIRGEIKAGHKWSIRADECQFLEMALMRRTLNNIK